MNFKLRKFRKGDEISLQRNINDKEIARNTLTIPYPYTMKDAKKWVKHNLKLTKKKKQNELHLVIDIDGEVAGSVGLNKIDYKNKKAEVGYWLARRYWGKGIMTSAIKQIVKIGFNRLKLNRIYACVFVFNKASVRVLEKAGFKLEGRLRKDVVKDGKAMDSLLYARVR